MDVITPNQNLFNALSNVCGFKAGQYEMALIIEAARKDQSLQDELKNIEDVRLKWSLETFKEATSESSLKKAIEEIKEIEADILMGIKNPEEYADALMCIFDSAGRQGITFDEIVTAYQEKVLINLDRKWTKNPDNTYSHVKEETKDEISYSKSVEEHFSKKYGPKGSKSRTEFEDKANRIVKGFEGNTPNPNNSMRAEFVKIQESDPIIKELLQKSSIHDYMERLKADIEAKKDAILSVKLEEFGIDIEKEKQKRFSNIRCEVNGKGEETWYYNDGSAQGKEIITFWVQPTNYDNLTTIELKHN